MRELEIKNVKTAQYHDFNFGSPEVVIYPNTGKVRIITGDMQKTFKIQSEVNYLDGE